MSVINKVLRDLDQRQAKRAGGASADPRRGTVSVPQPGTASAAAGARRSRMIFVALVALLIGVTVLDQWPSVATLQAVARKVTGSAQPAVAVPVATLPITVPAPVVYQDGAAPVPPASAAAPVAMAASAPAASVTSALAATPTSTPSATTPMVTVSPATSAKPAAIPTAKPDAGLRMETFLDMRQLRQMASAELPAPEVVPPKPRSTEPATAVGSARPPASATEVLTQAQQLWAGGAHDAGVELLQQALARAERADVSAPGGVHAILRELVRMQLADGRLSYVWNLLVQQDAQLKDASDLWAIRAHAAQRLGRYQDSVSAYLRALQLKPGEQRWLLGAAVSYAALGQNANATEFANKARAIGPVSADIVAYLRQAGVTLSSP